MLWEQIARAVDGSLRWIARRTSLLTNPKYYFGYIIGRYAGVLEINPKEPKTIVEISEPHPKKRKLEPSLHGGGAAEGGA